ncbi:MAG: glycosyltransferase [Nitrospirota bacterium]
MSSENKMHSNTIYVPTLLLQKLKEIIPHKMKLSIRRVIDNVFENKTRRYFKKVIDNDNNTYAQHIFTSENKLNITLYIGMLGAGGSERQLSNLALKLSEMGHNVMVLSDNISEAYSHYLFRLTELGIPVKQLKRYRFKNNIHDTKLPVNITALRKAPYYLKANIIALVNELCLNQPDVLHCWLDNSNISGGLAGIISAIPKIVLSGRSINPTHFSYLTQPWFKPWYEILINNKRVIMCNNSMRGAEDYAQWLNISVSDIAVVNNAINPDLFKFTQNDDHMKIRDSIGISITDQLIGGFFRLSPEKLITDFIKVVWECKEKSSKIKAIIAGTGTEEKLIKYWIAKLNLTDTVFLLGNRTDVFSVMRVCNIILLTSEYEGLPNCLMEAQYLGIPVVATRTGGIPEIVKNGITGELHEVGDVENMAKSIMKILSNKNYADRLGEQGHLLIRQNFSIERMAEGFLNLYKSVKNENKMLL